MNSLLTQREMPTPTRIPDDVLEQIIEIQARMKRPFVETHFFTAAQYEWLLTMIERGHR